MKYVYLTFIYLPAVCFYSCSKSDIPEPSGKVVNQMILANEGGSIETEDGIELIIPPDALAQDTEISLQALPGNSFDEFGIVGVQLEPEGLEFDDEVTLRFPLPSDWNAAEAPAVYYSADDNTDDFFLTLDAASISGSPGAYFGEIDIRHFSAWGLARNCHAGTIKFLFEDFISAGCDLDRMTDQVQDKWYDSFKVEPYNYNGDPQEFSLGNVSIQCFLDVYFEDHRSFNPGEDISDAYLESLRRLLEDSGKSVAVGFATEWLDINGDNLFDKFDHSAALEIVNGELKLRQSVSVNKNVIQKVLEAKGDNVVYYPSNGELTADLFNAYRLERSGVLLEQAICGSINCLFSATLNERIYPYRATRFYVSNYGNGDNPCEPNVSEYTTCYFHVEVSEVIETTTYFNTGQSSTGQVNGTVFGGTYTGTMNGDIFTGTRENPGGNGTLNTTISVTLNDQRDRVTQMHVYYHFEGNFTSERELIVSNIPYYEPPASYKVEYITTCDHIDLFTTKTTYTDRETVMDSFDCIIGDEILEIHLF